MPDWMWPAGLAILGAIVGSFLATIVIRWPEDRSAIRGRSNCDACRRQLAAWELVPLASAVILRGKCRSCATPIDATHWQIELACAALGVISGLAAPGPVGAAGAVFGWLLVALAALDVTEYWLPDFLVIPLAILGGASAWIAPPELRDRLIGGAAGALSLLAIRFAYKLARGREGMGLGDPKLLGAIGLWVGWAMLPFVLLIASAAGLAAVALKRLRGEPVSGADRVPLGALMAVAAYPVWLVMIAFGG